MFRERKRPSAARRQSKKDWRYIKSTNHKSAGIAPLGYKGWDIMLELAALRFSNITNSTKGPKNQRMSEGDGSRVQSCPNYIHRSNSTDRSKTRLSER